MRVLTVRQPWATLIAIGAKQIETRSWRTHYRGPVAIHAAKKAVNPTELVELPLGLSIAEAMDKAGYVNLYELPLGSVIAVCDLFDCVPITEYTEPGYPERWFGDYTPGRYAWNLSNVRALAQPIPAKGRLGLWYPDDDLLEVMHNATNW